MKIVYFGWCECGCKFGVDEDKIRRNPEFELGSTGNILCPFADCPECGTECEVEKYEIEEDGV